ncbi:unnamed protein product, partial [Didymodactylos carnosus]
EEVTEYYAKNDTLIETIIVKLLTNYSTKVDILNVCFTDHYGRRLNCGSIDNIPRISDTNDIHINVEPKEAYLLQLSIIKPSSFGNDNISNLFVSTTKWQQLYNYIKHESELRTELSTTDFCFWNRKQNHLIDNLLTKILISEGKYDQHEVSFLIDGISNDDVIKVCIEFDSETIMIYTLTSVLLSTMLENEYLNQRNLSVDDITVMHNHDIIHNFQQPLSNFLFKDLDHTDGDTDTTEKQSDVDLLSFQLCTLVTITLLQNQRTVQIPLKTNSMSVSKVIQYVCEKLKLNENDKFYLATSLMDMVDRNSPLENINERKFFLLKENETCLISIRKDENIELLIDISDTSNYFYDEKRMGRTTTIATVREVFKIQSDQNLMCDNDFVPSTETVITTLLLPNVTSLTFTVDSSKRFPLQVTLTKNEKFLIKLNCSDSITCERLCEIGCLVLREDSTLYDLYLSQCLLDKSITLNEINEANESNVISNVNEFNLVCTAQTNCLVDFNLDNDSISGIQIPCEASMPAKYVFETALRKLDQQQEQSELALYYENDIYTELDLTIEELINALPPERSVGEILRFTIRK